jgi:hypothetical protein
MQLDTICVVPFALVTYAISQRRTSIGGMFRMFSIAQRLVILFGSLGSAKGF